MSPAIVSIIIVLYFLALLIISYFTSRKADNDTFFTGNRKSPWFLVAFGMIGASLSGVTFISVPGNVGKADFSYFQLVLGYLLGYFVIYSVLLPLYYRLNLVSIYGYLKDRYGVKSYKTGSVFFLISQTMGASFRLFLVAGVLQLGFFDSFGIPFEVTVMITILLIWLYTFKAGIKTIVWTDTLQTLFMLLAVGITIYIVASELSLDVAGVVDTIKSHPYSKVFVWDWQSDKNFFKQFFSGAFIAIVMTGLDQNMMQKNLTCRNLRDSQKNMFWFSLILVPVNLLFLSMGLLLYVFAANMGISLPERSDDLFPMLAFHPDFSLYAGVVFLLGIIAAAFSSADSALTSLTTSFCVDFLKFEEKKDETKKKKIRLLVHVGFSLLMLIVIVLFKAINDRSVIDSVFIVAGYTYGPLLGLYAFGLLLKLKVKDKYVPVVAILSPVICYIVSKNSESWLGGYKFGFELLILNGILTFAGLLIIAKRKVNE